MTLHSDCNYNIPLNQNPPTPDSSSVNQWLEEGESVVKTEADKWVAAHHEHYQPALMALVEKIQRIHHSTFEKHLKLATENFNKQLEGAEDKTFTVLVQGNKSNQWVTELALKYLSYEPTESLSLGEKQARDFCGYLDRITDQGRVPRRIVLFDDASYSGTQLAEHVKAIVEKFKNLNLEPPIIHVIVPFATQYAVNRLERLQQQEQIGEIKTEGMEEKRSLSPAGVEEIITENSSSPPKAKIVLSLSAKIQSVAKALSDEHIGRLKELYGWSDDLMESRGRGLIYFDHKIPNGMSFVEPFGTGAVYPGKGEHQLKTISKGRFKTLPPIIPPYKG